MGEAVSRQEHKPVILLQPLWQWIVLCMFTAGIYPMYWSYQLWKELRDDNELVHDPVFDVILHPIVRGFFDWIFSLSLYHTMIRATAKHGYKADFSPFWYAVSYSFLRLLSGFPQYPWVALIFVFWFPYIPLFYTHRHYQLSKEAYCIPKRFFSAIEILLLFVGSYLTASLIYILMNPEVLKQIKSGL